MEPIFATSTVTILSAGLVVYLVVRKSKNTYKKKKYIKFNEVNTP